MVELGRDAKNAPSKVITSNTIHGFSPEDAYFICQLTTVETDIVLEETVPTEVQKLLLEYEDLFTHPKGLPH